MSCLQAAEIIYYLDYHPTVIMTEPAHACTSLRSSDDDPEFNLKSLNCLHVCQRGRHPQVVTCLPDDNAVLQFVSSVSELTSY